MTQHPAASARERLGHFELVRSLGAGGMGEVYEAIDTRGGQRVALKMLFEVDPAGVYRLKREFRRMADISHENLVTLHELCNEGDRWFFSMELLTGGDLRSAMQAAVTPQRPGRDSEPPAAARPRRARAASGWADPPRPQALERARDR
jgi:serine/threonine protein kinase